MQNYPKAIGAYSVFREAGGLLLFISGQIPINPATAELVSDDFKAQCKQVFQNIAAILSENGLGFDSVVKTTCFLSDINDFAAFNEVYAEFFTPPYPARSALAVKALPKNAKIEIELIAQKWFLKLKFHLEREILKIKIVKIWNFLNENFKNLNEIL